MIFDALENLHIYTGIHPGFAHVQQFLSMTDLKSLAVGTYQVNEQGLFASVNEYTTKNMEDSFIECHSKYIDIQIITCGVEKIGVTQKKFCQHEPYMEENDLQKLTGSVDFITLFPSMFALFFPHDAHEPGVISGESPVSVKKIVFKIPVL